MGTLVRMPPKHHDEMRVRPRAKAKNNPAEALKQRVIVIKIDDDVELAATFMQANFPATKLTA